MAIPPIPNGSAAGAQGANGTSTDASPPQSSQSSQSTQLPPEALELASRLFDMARQNSPLLLPYLSAGIPPNLTNSEGDTILMLAAYHGHADLVSGILDGGADVNALNGRGQSPLSGAVFKDHREVVRVLVAHGADVRIGRPDSVQTAGMFKRRECAAMMGVSLEEAVASLPEGVVIGPHGNMGG